MKNKLNYKAAGVNIEAGNALVKRIKQLAVETRRPEVLGGIGGFNALFALPSYQYEEPILVSATDGVGTKLKLALKAEVHHTIGIDLVAMCVNDLIVCGAEPLFFLDYFATSQLNITIAEEVLKGIVQGCHEAGAALIGGETAEMPGMYQGEDYDLAGFCVGIVEKAQIIDGSNITPGDTLIALGSSGVHSNGYSLIHAILAREKIDLNATLDEATFKQHLLTPTLIYVKACEQLRKTLPVHGFAHITGGGLTENLPRILPSTMTAIINTQSWTFPSIFQWLQDKSQLSDLEMYQTFNCGVGMVACIPSVHAKLALEVLKDQNIIAWPLGTIQEREANQSQIQFK